MVTQISAQVLQKAIFVHLILAERNKIIWRDELSNREIRNCKKISGKNSLQVIPTYVCGWVSEWLHFL